MKHPAGNLFSAIPQKVSQEIVESLVETGFCHLERIISPGQDAPGDWYDQTGGEWVVLLKGRAGLRFEGEEVQELGPGDYVWIDAHRRHRVEWTGQDEAVIWLALHVRGKALVEED